MFDFPVPAPQVGGPPVDFPGVEHPVAAFADVDEGGFHCWQDVLHATQINVSGEGRLGVRGDEMFHQHVVFQDAHLGDDTRVVVALAFPHHHGAVDGFPARQEFGFGDDVPFFAGFFPHFHAASALGF